MSGTLDNVKRSRRKSPEGYKCGKCGEMGHNTRTCGQQKNIDVAAKSPRKRRKSPSGYKCGKCGERGHNARTCNVAVEESEDSSE